MKNKPLNILILDTETTGLPESNDISPSEWNRWPRMIQLGYIRWLYLDGKAVPITIRSTIIQPEGFLIPDSAIEIHHITNDQAIRGHYIDTVLEDLSVELEESDIVVAHNLKFDKGVILGECFRKGLNPNIFNNCHQICTREETRSICNIMKDGQPKYPKLSELYQFCFGHSFSGAHDALSDVAALSHCFFELSDRLLPQ